MAKVKAGDDFDVDALDVEFEDREDFTEYDGPTPKRGTILRGRIKRAWYGESSTGNKMLTVIWEAEQNGGDKAEYNGLGIFDYITFTPKAAFKYKPWLAMFGLKLSDVKDRMVTDGEETDQGIPLTKIGKWVIGSDDALCRVTTKIERYEGEQRAKISKYMPDAEDDEFSDEPDGGKKAKGGKAKGGHAKKGKGKKAAEDAPF